MAQVYSASRLEYEFASKKYIALTFAAATLLLLIRKLGTFVGFIPSTSLLSEYTQSGWWVVLLSGITVLYFNEVEKSLSKGALAGMPRAYKTASAGMVILFLASLVVMIGYSWYHSWPKHW